MMIFQKNLNAIKVIRKVNRKLIKKIIGYTANIVFEDDTILRSYIYKKISIVQTIYIYIYRFSFSDFHYSRKTFAVNQSTSLGLVPHIFSAIPHS